MTTTSPNQIGIETEAGQQKGSVAVALLRITLGVILLATWWGNIGDDFYTADGFKGFLDWLVLSGEEGGNGSSLTFFHDLLDATIVPVAGLAAFGQLIMEGLAGLLLVVGGATRLASLWSMGFFAILFLSYFGGEEWIWTYVLLFMAALTVFLGYGGRQLGLDQIIAKAKGSSFGGLIW